MNSNNSFLSSKVLIAVAFLAPLSVLTGCTKQDESANPADKVVHASGKSVAEVDAVPAAVLAAALKARPELTVQGVEYEQRDGREYYDVGGTLADGSEIELDMLLRDGIWTVAEVQRDLEMEQVPEPVRAQLSEHVPGWQPERIIESDQGSGLVIYEFFTDQGSAMMVKKEIKWHNNQAEMLLEEWQH